jgi:hypothetical protein
LLTLIIQAKVKGASYMTNYTSDDPNRLSRADQRLKWLVVASLVIIEFALLALIGLLTITTAPSEELLIAMFAAVTVIAVLIFLTAARLFRVVGLEVSREGIRAAIQSEIQPVKEGIDEANEKIDELFLTSMSPEMFYNLKKLESGKFGHFTKGEGLDRELRYLRSIGYIKVDSFDAIPEEGEDLSMWVEITDQGKQFVELRKKLEDERKLIGNQP